MIHVLSRPRLLEAVKQNPNKLNVLLISGEWDRTDESIIEIKALAARHEHLIFDDITFAIPSGVLPSQSEIAKGLAFSTDPNEDIYVACRAGISRSSAMAYLIRCKYCKPDIAAQMWNIEIHDPNSKVVKIGAKLLNDRNIWIAYKRWDKA